MNKIHAFCSGKLSGPTRWGDGDVMGVALDDDGWLVSQHYCSSPQWAEKDMARPHHQERYAERYPDGYEYEWYGHGEENLPDHVLSQLRAHRAEAASQPSEVVDR